MFTQYIDRLESTKRLDAVVHTPKLEIGEVEIPGTEPRLAVQAPGHDPMIFEEHGGRQFLSQWGIQVEPFSRLPRNLQQSVLLHFTRNEPRSLTLRSTQDAESRFPAIRSVMSGRYRRFDNADVLRVIEPYVGDYELRRQSIDRDEMAIALTRPESHDVSLKRTGDIVKAGVMIRNSEIGTMALRVDLSIWRLVCLNGLVLPVPKVTVVQRHIYVSEEGFVRQLREALAEVVDRGLLMVRQLQEAHAIALPNLDPDEGKAQREIVRVLRKENIWNSSFKSAAEEVLGGAEEASLFGLVQFLTGEFAKQASEEQRLSRERAAGRLLSLAA